MCPDILKRMMYHDQAAKKQNNNNRGNKSGLVRSLVEGQSTETSQLTQYKRALYEM